MPRELHDVTAKHVLAELSDSVLNKLQLVQDHAAQLAEKET